jgi:PAS domain-containing protein
LRVASQRTADEALRRSQERLQLALDGSGDTLLDWDLRSGELYLSEHWARMTGGQPGAAVTTVRDLLELIHPGEHCLGRALDETLRESVVPAQYRRAAALAVGRTHAGDGAPETAPLRVTEPADSPTARTSRRASPSSWPPSATSCARRCPR